MSGILETVNSRTQLAGKNRMELLLFQLTTKQFYGINVFKVREIIKCPLLSLIPKCNPMVRGISYIRGVIIPIIDLNMAIGKEPLVNPEEKLVIIAEYNRTVQGFMVESVSKIVNISWEVICPPPPGTGDSSYLTAVTEIDNELVEIIDVEKVLQEVAPVDTSVAENRQEVAKHHHPKTKHILICDDSAVARKQTVKALEQLHVDIILKNNGREAYNYLKEITKDGSNVTDKLLMLISDVEMPEMDGYKLTAEVRDDPNLQGLFVLLHTSLSGIFNKALVNKVNANQFIAKFDADALAQAVIDRMEYIDGTK